MPLRVNAQGVWAVAFSPDGKTLAAVCRNYLGDGGVVLWDVAARRRLADEPFPVNDGTVPDVAVSPDLKSLAAGFNGFGRSSGVMLWDVAVRGAWRTSRSR